LSGRVADDKKLLPVAALGLVGSILASLPLLVFGLADKPVRQAVVFDVGGSAAIWSGLSALGLVMVVLAVVAGVAAVRVGSPAPDDPWDGHTLEWAVPSPAPVDNFAELALVGSAEPLLDVKPREVAP
jgi:heme/copper-type cytochrome/quinol oxidase subunit 1